MKHDFLYINICCALMEVLKAWTWKGEGFNSSRVAQQMLMYIYIYIKKKKKKKMIAITV